MYRIQNRNLANQRVVTSYGVITFDDNGIAEIPSPELYLALLKIYGFEPVEEEKPRENAVPIGGDKESSDLAIEEEARKVVEVEELQESTIRRARRKKAAEAEGD